MAKNVNNAYQFHAFEAILYIYQCTFVRIAYSRIFEAKDVYETETVMLTSPIYYDS